MHIPARYYKRIPTFYFIVGILLVITSFNMGHNPLAAYLYFMAGVVSVIYSVSVFQARKKRRKSQSPQGLGATIDEEAPIEDMPPPESKRPEFINDNESAGENSSSADDDEAAAAEPSASATEDRDLPQQGGGVASPAQPKAKP